MFYKISLIFIFALFSFQQDTFAQAKSPNLSPEEVEAYQNQCRQMMHYLEGTLNFLGQPENLPSEKEIILNSSYLKIFKDNKVQIEDDLDENREVSFRKDVQAYLKDVVFFYKKVKFNLHITSITPGVNENGELYFKVTLNRNLQGITVNNDTVENNQLRYVEINLDQANNSLKIASIYTNKPNENAELRFWWNHLSQAWKDYFGKSILVYDSLPMNSILHFGDTSLITSVEKPVVLNDTAIQSDTAIQNDTAIQSDTLTSELADTLYMNTNLLAQIVKQLQKTQQVDISNNLNIISLNPLSDLSDLKSLNCSHTLIDDLTPLRSLNKLETLNITGCPVSDLSPLRYVSALREIDADYTPLQNADVVSSLKLLETLNLGHTSIDTLPGFNNLHNLRTLELSCTPIRQIDSLSSLYKLVNLNLSRCILDDFSPLRAMKSLQILNLDSTNIQDVSSIDSLYSLSILQINGTRVSKILPLAALPNLKYIYCDYSGIHQAEAARFNAINTQCQVIFNSAKLESWWTGLPVEWKTVFSSYTHVDNPATKEQLHRLLQLKEIDVHNNRRIKNVQPLSFLAHIRKLNISGTSVQQLNGLEGLGGLRELNAGKTAISNLEPLKNLKNMKSISIENTEVSNLLPLANNSNLSIIYADGSKVSKKNVLRFNQQLPHCLVVYQTKTLRFWWKNLTKDWQDIFRSQIEIDKIPTKEQLQQLAGLRKLNIRNDLKINSLESLSVFENLQELYIDNTAIQDISPLFGLKKLETLAVRNSPLTEIDGIDELQRLKKLDFSNTSIENLEAIQNLSHLQSLNISGTRVKSLKPLQHLTQLKELFINNTRIGTLKHINQLTQLKLLRCNNSSINQRKVQDFKHLHPNTKVIFY